MKKIIFALLVFILFCFSGCGNKTQQNSQTLGEMSKAYNENTTGNEFLWYFFKLFLI